MEILAITAFRNNTVTILSVIVLRKRFLIRMNFSYFLEKNFQVKYMRSIEIMDRILFHTLRVLISLFLIFQSVSDEREYIKPIMILKNLTPLKIIPNTISKTSIERNQPGAQDVYTMTLVKEFILTIFVVMDLKFYNQ